MNRSAVRTILVIFGMFVLMIANALIQNGIAAGSGLASDHFVIVSISLALSLYGYYLWARLKGRHWAWMLLGLASPLGTVPIALLRDRRQ
jgi:hypothetical protein